MSEFLASDVQVGFSKLPQVGINTMYQLTADFASGLVHQFPPVIPQGEFVTDEDMIGRGNEFPTQNQLYRWAQRGYAFTGKCNTEMFAVMLARFLGGSITNTVVTATTSWDHTIVMQTSGTRVPKMTTMYLPIGGADFLFPMAVNSISIQQNADEQPTFSMDLVGTGLHQRHRDIVTPIVLPDPPLYHYPHGAATFVALNDGSLVNLSSLGRIRSLSAGATQNIRVGDRRPGDPFLEAGNVRSGSYARFLNRGKRSGSAQVKLSLDENRHEYDWVKNGTPITAFVIKLVAEKIGASTDSFEVEWAIPNLSLQVIDGDQEGDDATITLNFINLEDAITGGLMVARIRNNVATLA